MLGHDTDAENTSDRTVYLPIVLMPYGNSYIIGGHLSRALVAINRQLPLGLAGPRTDCGRPTDFGGAIPCWRLHLRCFPDDGLSFISIGVISTAG
jgi:hypothetical protein